MVGFIYKITNTVNGKCYIGQTVKKNPEQRWKQHIRNSRYKQYSSIVLYKAMNKYGLQNFTFEVIVGNVPVGLLNDLETNCIAAYNGYTKGYNTLEYGESVQGYKHKPETLAKLGKHSIGCIPVNKGKKFPELSGKYHAGAKSVTCINNGVVYDTGREAAKALGVNPSSVAAVCKGKRSQTHGLKFKYTGSEAPPSTEDKRHGANNVNAKAVVCTTTGKEYGSITEAANDIGASYQSVARVCKGIYKYVFGTYKFKYKD